MGDKLTGLMDRREFDERFRELIAEAQSGAEELSLVMLDIDHFKRVNDDFGHVAGDAVIQWLAFAIKERADSNAVCARFGGEEFAILLPRVEREQAFLLAESLRAAAESADRFRVQRRDVDLPITISGGVASFPTDGRTESDVLRKVDQALYRAKETGRNKVCIAQEEKMATKTTHYTLTQLERLSKLAKEENVGEAILLREALDDLLIKYKVSEVES
jgi:diguanylate cyclase (GGDEF)-like protein